MNTAIDKKDKSETLKEKTAKGLLWGGLSNGLQQFLNLAFGIYLARKLSQSDYGMIGMLLIFSQLASTMQEGGFISAINRKKTVSHADYNAVFWTSVLISLTFYSILFLSAPLIADFYGIPELTTLARYMFISIFITSLGIAPRAYIFRNMMVRENAIISVTCLLVSGLVAVWMASNDFGYWTIATQTIIYVSVSTLLNHCLAKWHPTLSFDLSPIKEIIGYSSKLIITNLVNIINNNIFSVIFGKIYTAHEVGNYTQANKWNTMGTTLINGMLFGVAQPVFAKTEEDQERQKRIFRKLLRFTAFVCFPAMFGLALTSKEFIVILLTEKWLASAQLLQILCIAGAFLPLSTLFSNLLISRGHSTVYMWCSIALCVAQLLAVYFSAPYGIGMMISVSVIIQIGWLFVWFYFARQEIALRLTEVVSDISPYLALTLALIAAAYLLTSNITNLYISFAVKVLFVGLSYCLVLWLLKSTIFLEAISFFFRNKRQIKK